MNKNYELIIENGFQLRASHKNKSTIFLTNQVDMSPYEQRFPDVHGFDFSQEHSYHYREVLELREFAAVADKDSLLNELMLEMIHEVPLLAAAKEASDIAVALPPITAKPTSTTRGRL